MLHINLETCLINLSLTSVSGQTAKKFIRAVDSWIDWQITFMPHISDMITRDMQEVFKHSKVSFASFEKIRQELASTYGLRFGMTDEEVREYQEAYYAENPQVARMFYLRHTDDKDVLAAVNVYQKAMDASTYLAKKKYCADWIRSGIVCPHAFAEIVLRAKGVLIFKGDASLDNKSE